MSNYFTAPVEPGALLGQFELRGAKGVPAEPITFEDAAQLAQTVNEAVARDGSAVWFNPETDSRAVRVHGEPVELGGRAVRLVSHMEVAVFPRPDIAT